MATSYKTPGVYVEEIPKLPPSVAQVETAIPAFVGYTEKAEKNGESLVNKPTRLNSMVEFVEYFGRDKKPDTISVVVDDANNYAVKSISVAAGKQFYLYDSLRVFFDNGGGDCYVVSVGTYKTSGSGVSVGDENNAAASPGLRVGVKELEKVDEPTIILFPDAVLLSSANEAQLYSLQQMALDQCAKLQDRVSVFDLYEAGSGGQPAAVANFRNNIGINNLKYGMAYTPWIATTYSREIDFASFKNTVTKSGGGAVSLGTISTDSSLNDLVSSLDNAGTDAGSISSFLAAASDAGDDGVIPGSASATPKATNLKDRYKLFVDAVKGASAATVAAKFKALMDFVRSTAKAFPGMTFSSTNLANDVTSYGSSPSLWRGAVSELIKIERNPEVWPLSGMANDGAVLTAYPGSLTAWLGGASSTFPSNGKNYDNDPPGPALSGVALALVIEADVKPQFDKLALFADTIASASTTYQKAAQDTLYEKHPVISSIVKNIKKELNKLPPSGAIAGVYARVDNARGVWKAPANESLNSVAGPTVAITADAQSSLNVDVVAGKSINAIRTFTGKGTLVWGARTLAGNDNEWRYINVRRFFNMVEESSKKATEPFVFEANDANTWVKVQGMIENFLTTLWRQGALQGAKPEHAFYVAVGLGKTMTALDILEGRMIIEIGMAVVRPAEFIILRFSHKMAES